MADGFFEVRGKRKAARAKRIRVLKSLVFCDLTTFAKALALADIRQS